MNEDEIKVLTNSIVILGEIAEIDFDHTQKKINDQEFVTKIKAVLQNKEKNDRPS